VQHVRVLALAYAPSFAALEREIASVPIVVADPVHDAVLFLTAELSGYGDEQHQAVGARSRLRAHLVKPVDPNGLQFLLAGTGD
jgi:hypothetical protein